MIVAITGATGFIGRHVTARFGERGDDVRAIVRRADLERTVLRPAIPASTSIVRAPLERTALTDAFRDVDVVVHLAGVLWSVNAQAYVAVNVDGTRAVAQASRDAGARLVHISSLAAAGPAPPSRPRVETDPPQPITPYGRSKLDSERAVQVVTGLRWTILRPGVVYGPGDRNMLPLFRAARAGFLPLVGRATAAYTFIHVSDTVRAIEAAIDNDAAGETIFVGHPQPVTARALLEGVRAAAGGRARIVRVPAPVTLVAALCCELAGRLRGRPLLLNRSRYAEIAAEGFVCSVDRLRDRLGVVAQIGLGEGLAKTAEWYRQEGWL